MDWVSPTGHNDPDTAWSNVGNNHLYEHAYDEDTDTYCQTKAKTTATTWSSFLELTFDSLVTNKLRFNVYGYGTARVDVDIYTGETWVDVYEGIYLNHTWEEKTFTQCAVTKVRIRQKPTDANRYSSIYEFDFWGTPWRPRSFGFIQG